MIDAKEAKQRLIAGNQKYMGAVTPHGDISADIRKETAENGQHPYAIGVTCSDSRVIPESIFSAGIGELFVVRVAGNVIDDHQLGSIEYAADHLGTGLVVVLGHTNCGAIDAVLSGHASGYIRYIAEDIAEAIGQEKDPYKACCLNVKHCCEKIESSLLIQEDEEKYGLQVIGAVYDIESGLVDFDIRGRERKNNKDPQSGRRLRALTAAKADKRTTIRSPVRTSSAGFDSHES